MERFVDLHAATPQDTVCTTQNYKWNVLPPHGILGALHSKLPFGTQNMNTR